MLQEDVLFVVSTTNCKYAFYDIFNSCSNYKYDMAYMFSYAKSMDTLSKVWYNSPYDVTVL